ncbi:MAG: PD40 domain-containing protein [Marinilabiliaceae bacterium]|nr:PD40 domain-containing protein [Marinilabiliaceae bacterium]
MHRSYLFLLLLLSCYCFSLSAQDIKISPISVNERHSSEIAPFFKDSVMLFASNRKSSLFVNYFNDNKEYLYHIYQSRLKPDSTWTKPTPFQPEPDFFIPFNTGSVIYSTDDSLIFVTQNHYDSYKRSKKSSNGNLMGVYMATKSKRGWSRKTNLSFNSKRDYNTGHPAISDDGRYLIYVSDQKDGHGKMDIYVSEFVNGEWGESQNMGDHINTSETEVFPYYHPSGKLFFASDGHGGAGGLDLFYVVQTATGWSDPIAFDSSINTSADEFGCYISEDEQWGFFASNRDDVDNIYRFDRLFPTFDVCTQQVEDNFCFTLEEDGPIEVDTLPYVYNWDFGDGQSARGGIVIDHCFPGPGTYRIKLDLIDTLINVEMLAVADYEVELERTQQIFISSKDTVTLGEAIDFDLTKSYFSDFKPEAFYWDMGDGTKLKGETILHIFRTKGKYQIKCGATSADSPQTKLCSFKEIIVID